MKQGSDAVSPELHGNGGMQDSQPDPRSAAASTPTRVDNTQPCDGVTEPRPQIPDHELLRVIGSGSYGDVWLARNLMGTYRAVKVVWRNHFAEDRPFEREFAGLKKYEPVSRTHDDLVDILQVGENGRLGYFYSVMELCDDVRTAQDIDPERYQPRTLARVLVERGALPFEECLQLGLALADGVGHLHEHGLIHRDLKPSNIIFVNGIPKIADIGLVAELGSVQSLVGTPGFIPPEGPGTAQADIFSLGKILYEISSGEDRQNFPEMPRQATVQSDGGRLAELWAVINRACEHDPEKRYQSAAELRADLLLLQAGKSVQRLRLLERRAALFAKIGVIAAILVLVAVAAYLQVSRQQRIDRQNLAASYVAYGTRLMDEGDLYGALPSYAAALALDEGSSRLASRDRVQLGVCLRQCPKLTRMWFLPAAVRNVSFSPSGKRLVVTGGSGEALVLDCEEERIHLELKGAGIEPFAGYAGFNPDGRWILTAGSDGTARLWDAETGQELQDLSPLRHGTRAGDERFGVAVASAEPVTGRPGDLTCAHFNPRGTRIVTGCTDGWVRVWDVGNRERPSLCFRAHELGILYVCFSPDGTSLVSCSQDGTARLWNASTGAPLHEKPFSHSSWVYQAAFNSRGNKMVTVGYDKLACLWDVQKGTLLACFQPQSAIGTVAFSPDDRDVALGCWDYGCTTRIWEPTVGGATRYVLRNTGYPMRVDYAPDGHHLAVAGADGTIRLWDLAGNAVDIAGDPVAYSSRGSRKALVHDRKLQIQVAGSEPISMKQDAAQPPVQRILFNPDGQKLLTVTAANQGSNLLAVQVWDTGTARTLGPSFALPWTEAIAALSPDGGRLVTAHGEVATLWDAKTGRALCDLSHSDAVEGVTFSPLGSRLVTWAGTNALLWVSENGRPVRQIGHPSLVGHVEFSPDGRCFVTCSTFTQFRPGCAELYDAESGRPLGRQFCHSDGVECAVFSPDGQRMMTASDDRSARIWDRTSGKQLTPPLVHRDQVLRACFSPDGGRVATLCRDRTIRIWEAASGIPLTPSLKLPIRVKDLQFIEGGKQVLCARLPRNLLTLDSVALDRWICDLSPDERPAAELSLEAQVLSGRRGAELGAGLPLEQETLQEGWRQVRARHPADFKVSESEVRAWHQTIARISEEAGDWQAACFHLRWLARLYPGDEDVARRLSRAEVELSTLPTSSR